MAHLSFPLSFDSADLASELCTLTAGVFGLCGCTLVITSVNRSTYVPGATAHLFTMLLFADGALCLVASLIGVTFLSNYKSGTDALKHEMTCEAYGGVILGCVFTSMMSLTAVTMERYRAVVLQRITTGREAASWCAGILSFAFGLGLLTAASGVMGEQPGRLICVTRWWVMETLWVTIVFLLILGGALTALIFFWIRIVQRIYTDTRFLRSQITTIDKNTRGPQRIFIISSKFVREIDEEATTRIRTDANMVERKVLRNALVVTCSFLVLWMPYALVIIISVATGQPLSSGFDQIAIIAATCNSALNPVLLYLLDKRVENSVQDYLWGFVIPTRTAHVILLHKRP